MFVSPITVMITGVENPDALKSPRLGWKDAAIALMLHGLRWAPAPMFTLRWSGPHDAIIALAQLNSTSRLHVEEYIPDDFKKPDAELVSALAPLCDGARPGEDKNRK